VTAEEQQHPQQPSFWEPKSLSKQGDPIRPKRSVIRASEIGTFLYCRRAWWYERKGKPSKNQAEMRGGTKLHTAHGKAVFTSGVLKSVGYLLLLLALILLTIYLTGKVI
jgi:hypothetical protein